MLKKLFLLPATLALVEFSGSELLAEGAFGFDFGQALPEKAEPMQKIQGGYRVEAPSPFPEFESYVVKYSDATGVCKIFGYGKTYEDDEWGTTVIKSYEKLITALSKKYGKVQREEFLRPGALYDEPEDFSRSLDKNQRYHQAFWEIESEYPTSTSEIMLSVNADWTDTWIYIHYISQDYSKCLTAIEEETEGSL